jgi:tRNA-specific 2-thiouridylase
MSDNKAKKKKVFVGLSGGVDSSVAAALLQKQGYDVTGVFIKIWQPQWGPCGWRDDRRDAMRVALHLEIPFRELDLSEQYEKEVVDYLIREYKAGRTPNPDVVCNTKIKFGDFLRWALKNGADAIATGHYTRISNNEFLISNQIPISKFKNTKYQIQNTRYQLLRAIDDTKDQSYFLWQLEQSQLQHCLFPVGDYKKSEVRKMAKKFDLHTSEKKDSQGICFVGKVGMKEFLKKYIKEKRGDVLNMRGQIIGYHDGAFFLTIGQRRGFTIMSKGDSDEPYYVIGKNIKDNTITVAPQKTKKQKNKKTIILNKVNWINEKPTEGKKYQARFRHLQSLLHCYIVTLSGKNCQIVFAKPQEGIAAGQSLVIYDGQKCLGGGIIK